MLTSNTFHDIFSEEILSTAPKVSIHMLAYKHERFITSAIEGVVNQKCNFPFELIIAEDGSPDCTLEIAKNFQKRYQKLIRVISQKANTGMHANLKFSIQYCRGDYIAFCEGDDFWQDPEKLQQQVDLFESNSNIVFCHTNYDHLTMLGVNQRIHGIAGVTPPRGNAYESLLPNWCLMTATMMYRRGIVIDFFASEFYNTKWPFGDLNMALYASLKGELGYLDASTATYREVAGSATNGGFKSKLNMEVATLECLNLFISRVPVPPDVAKNAIAKRTLLVYRAAYFCGDVQKMEECRQWMHLHRLYFNDIIHAVKCILTRIPPIHRLHRKKMDR